MRTAPTTTESPIHFWSPPDLPGLEFDPFLSRMLHEEPVSRIRLPNGAGHAWLVTRHADVRLVSADPRFSRRAVLGRDVTRVAPHFIPMDGATAFADPPDHTRMRRVVAGAFTARSMRRLRDRAQQVLDGLLDEMERHGSPADLVAHVARPFPQAMVSELMGVPARDRESMAHWTDGILSAAAGRTASERAKAALADRFAALIGAARRAPAARLPHQVPADGDARREQLVDVLADGVEAGTIGFDEAVGLAVLIQIGGTHAVRNNSANMVYALLTHPHQLARLRAEPALVPRAVDELLRYIPHRNAVGLARIALEDVEVGGVTIPAGDAVYVSYLSANRDPEVFADPERLDLDRDDAASHLAFAHGPHYCPGATLARLESEVLLATLWDRFPGLRLAVPEDELRWQRGVLIRGPEELPVRW
ncbi:cytochrome P450 [Streptomyces sp. NPDC127106]|uniref:cytochrome P450 n=1 Tax=Streptomyces sp. NPDC127106 TaxID=3345360 RepID=UPI00362AEA31